MNVSVVGPGAIGCLFSARLVKSGISTTLVDYKADLAARLRHSGIIVESQEGSFVGRPATALSVPSGQDLIIVLTKAHSTRSLRMPSDTPILTLQNGLGNVETLCELTGSAANVMAGVTSEAATLLEEGKVRHAAKGVTIIGAWTSCPIELALGIFRKAEFDVQVTESPGQTLWEKVAVNAGINPLTALLNVPNGRLIEIPEARKLMRDLVVESTKVALTEGYKFNRSLVEYAEAVCLQTKDNISSMLQDVRAGKKTEIDAISGEIVRRGEVAGLPTPRTRVVYQLVKGLEQR